MVRSLAARFAHLTAGVVVSMAVVAHAVADEFQWAGTGTTNWSVGSNWAGGVAPPVGGSTSTSLVFGSPTTSNYNATNDLAGVFTLNHLTLANNTKAVIQVRSASGSGLAFDGPNARFDYTGVGAQTFANVSGGLGIALNTNLKIAMSSLGSLTISAPISGTNGITIEGPELASNVGVISLSSGATGNTFSGGVTLNSGNLFIDGTTGTATPLGAGTFTINGGNIGFNATTSRIAVPVAVNSDLIVSRGTGTINGAITYNNPAATLQVYGGSLNLNVPSDHAGATILGGRDSYAASTGPATITLGTNSTTNGTLLNTSSIKLLAGATLNIENSTTNLADRVRDTAPITMQSGTISLRANNSGSTETVGDISLAGFSTLEARPGAASPFGAGILTANSITRTDHGVLFVRGQNLGVPTASPTSTTKYAEIKVAGAGPALVGGGGGAGSTNISIVPWAVAAYSTTSSTTTNPNSFTTYDAVNGFRPLNTATEFSTTLGVDATQNVNLTANTNNDSAASVNALLLSSTGSVSITGSGNIAVTSGAVLAGVGGSSSIVSNGLSFGSTEAMVTTTGPLTVTGSITGSGGFTKSGANSLILTGDNGGVSGPLTINGFASANASRIDVGTELNLPGNGPIHIYSGASTASAGIGVSNTLAGTTLPITISRPIVLETGLCGLNTLNSSTEAHFTGNISGNGSLAINASSSFGLVELTGMNTYTGITRINAGTLRIHSDANLGNGGALVLATNTLTQGLELADDWSTSRTVHTLFQSGIQTWEHTAILNGPLTGSSNISKYGTGALVLNADSPYTGTIFDGEGSVFVNAITGATMSVTNAIFGGTGRVGDVSLLGVLAPGSEAVPVATLSMSSLAIYGTSVVAFDLGPAGDLIKVDNALSLNTTYGSVVTFNFSELPGLQVGGVYDLCDFGSSAVTLANFGFVGPAGLDGVFQLSAHSLLFEVTSVPEPSSIVLLALASAIVLRRARTR